MSTQHDIVVFGATSFVGKILTTYMLEQQETLQLSWAIAARSQQKLDALARELGAEDIPQILADSADADSLRKLCDSTRVVISTVGPYALYGDKLIEACVESGTDYCDLTGEVQWIKRMLDQHEEAAKASGARIVHCCGFDSIPSDLGVHFLQQQALERFGQTCNQIDMRVKTMKGGASGGTIASMINVAQEAAADPSLRKQLADPYLICPDEAGFQQRQVNIKTGFDDNEDSWYAPFVMEAINSRVVHRSNALKDSAYGENFKYSEAMLTGGGNAGKRRAKGLYYGMGAFMLGTAIPPTRWLMQRFMLPKPGEGPSPKEQLEGRFDCRFTGTTANGDKLRCRVTGDRDPGYGSTAKMLGQAGACLAQDLSDDQPGGFWTPASLLGDRLIERLQRHSGLTFEIID
jgi:short subunit dehydrogenase-like uncharacterized protein